MMHMRATLFFIAGMTLASPAMAEILLTYDVQACLKYVPYSCFKDAKKLAKSEREEKYQQCSPAYAKCLENRMKMPISERVPQ